MARILVADDEPQILEMMQMTCELDGHEVRGALDTETALSVFGEFRPDLVILDLNMPGGGGETVLGQIGSGEAQWVCPVIVVSGFVADMGSIAKDSPYVKQILEKPFNIEHLRTAIREAMTAGI